jgi:hypothetical protein
MKKIIKNVFLGISAIVSIAIISKIAGHPPRGVEQVILYAFPGGILMFFIFDPLMKAFSDRKDDKNNIKSESSGTISQFPEKKPTQQTILFLKKY